MMKYILVCAVLFLPHSFAVPLASDPEEPSNKDLKFSMMYLDKYYPSYGKASDLGLEERIKEMQKFFHLTVTGKFNKETLRVMRKPRCGVSDVNRRGRVQVWRKKVLTYRINKYTPDLPKRRVQQIIAKAFKVWSDVTPLQFKETSKRADIEIGFYHGAHPDDPYPFDGRLNILAHAFFPAPGIGGDAHFDESEKWSEYNKEINLFLVAAHEFGHSLGLEHSNVRGALMYPTYSYVNPKTFKLSKNDKQRIQKLYGSRKRNL